MKRLDNPHSTGKRNFVEHQRKYKAFDPSITDKSSFTPLADQLKRIAPMTQEEINSHFDFIKGSKDDGRSMPLRQGADIAELQESINAKRKSLNNKLDKIAKESLDKAKIIEIQRSAESNLIKE